VNDTTPIPSGATANPTTTPAAVTVGSGADTLVLNMAEDPYQGDAQFTVSVDGQQIGGVQTTTAVVGQGQFQEFDVNGNFGPGTHTVSVDFLNDAVGGYYPPGTPGLPAGTQWALDTEDRNLYVMGMSLDGGTPASGAPYEISSDGTENFTVTAGSNPSATAFNSGLFGTDGAAATSDNAAIPSGSLSVTGSGSGSSSSSGMSFIAPSTTSGTSGSSTSTTAPASGSSGSSGSSSDTGSSAVAATSGTTTATQDFTVPSTTGSSGSSSGSSGSDPTTTSGSSGTWWTSHHTGTNGGSGFHAHG
jgi:hypothetical protein